MVVFGPSKPCICDNGCRVWPRAINERLLIVLEQSSYVRASSLGGSWSRGEGGWLVSRLEGDGSELAGYTLFGAQTYHRHCDLIT